MGISDFEVSDALRVIVRIINGGSMHEELYILMIQEFYSNLDAGETPKMSLALAKEALELYE